MLNQIKLCVVYSHACLVAVFFFTAFTGAVTVEQWRTVKRAESASSHLSAGVQYKQKWDPLVKTLLRSAASGQKLHREPCCDHTGLHTPYWFLWGTCWGVLASSWVDLHVWPLILEVLIIYTLSI